MNIIFVETLGIKPWRLLTKRLSSLNTSWENSRRGCRTVVKLGSLNMSAASRGSRPEPCSKDQSDEITDHCDKEIMCDPRQVKCDYCGQMVLHKNFVQHVCKHTCEMKAELKEVRSKQDEILRMVQLMMSSLARLEENAVQRSESSHASSVQEFQAEIVVAGGLECKSVEVFNMATKIWQPLSQMKISRHASSSVFYHGHMIVTGGDDTQGWQALNSVEELNLAQEDGHWLESQFQLPVPSQGHKCLVYKNHAFIIGGRDGNKVYDTIHEIRLTPPYTSRILTRMPKPVCYHGAEIVNDKILIVGGSTTGSYKHTICTVLIFDPASNICTELKQLPHPVSHMTTVTWKDNVVVLGGMNDQGDILNTVILYNVTTECHRMLPGMTEKRFGCTSEIIGDNIITIGGKDESRKDLNSVECFNFDINTWTEFPALTEPRFRATSVVKYF